MTLCKVLQTFSQDTIKYLKYLFAGVWIVLFSQGYGASLKMPLHLIDLTALTCDPPSMLICPAWPTTSTTCWPCTCLTLLHSPVTPLACWSALRDLRPLRPPDPALDWPCCEARAWCISLTTLKKTNTGKNYLSHVMSLKQLDVDVSPKKKETDRRTERQTDLR